MRIHPRLVSSVFRTRWDAVADKHLSQLRRSISNVAQRAALKPSMVELDRVLQQADKIVGTSASSHNLQHLLSEEVSVVTQILCKLVGTNNSLSAIEQFYQNGAHSDQLIRGLSVLLTSRAGAVSQASDQYNTENSDKAINNISHEELVLAKVVEMINMAMLIHKEICNIESGSYETQEGSQTHLNNKISVLYGDFLWAKAWKDLADLHQIEVTDMMVSVLVNTTQGQFVSEEELKDVSTKLNLEYWLEKNFLLSACLPAFGCKSVLKLAQTDPTLQDQGYLFGQNLGYYIKAHQEIQWFMNKTANSREVLDFCSLPVVLHSMESGDQSVLPFITKLDTRSSNFLEFKQPKFNHAGLHSLIRSGSALSKSKTVLEMFRANAYTNLNHFPSSEARDCLKKILNAMNVE